MHNFIKLGSLLGLSIISASLTTNLTYSTNVTKNSILSQKAQIDQKDYINTLTKTLDILKENEKKEFEKTKFLNKKTYTQGLNEFRWNGLTLTGEVWITKDLMAQISVILGAIVASVGTIGAISGPVLSFGVAIGVLAMTAATVELLASISVVATAIIALLYTAATADVIVHLLKAPHGIYFKFDKTVVGTPITIMSTLRYQNSDETAKILKNPNAHNHTESTSKDSVNAISEDENTYILEQFWHLPKEGAESYSGIIDISRATSELASHKIISIEGIIAMRDYKNQQIWNEDIHDRKNEKTLTFLQEYFNNKNDYIFWSMSVSNKKDYFILSIGGHDEHNNDSDWHQIGLLHKGQLQDLALSLTIHLEKK